MACRKLPGVQIQSILLKWNIVTKPPKHKLFTLACRILENHQREQKEHYETQTEGLKLKVDHLQNENNKLQKLFQEKSNINDVIRQEVSRLSSENAVCYSFLPSTFHFLGPGGLQNILLLVALSLLKCDSQVIPELKLQVSELQRQKQEVEAHVEEQRKELAGTDVDFFPS